ncbi:MAG: beta-galactosidase, partial [Lentisphaeria bacterium]
MTEKSPLPFFVFGSQYHRAPVPPPDEWEEDFARMRGLGFNTMKFWLIWRWVEREPGRYFWETYDALLAAAHQAGLKVVPNIILEMAPEWVYRRHPEALLMDAAGRPAQDLCGQAYQLGGFCPNWDCQEAFDQGLDFMRQAVSRYASHPAVLTIDIWNEPVCLPSHGAASQRRFRDWLRGRFGTIAAYNAHTGQAEAAFEDVRLPTSPFHFPKSLLHHEYMIERLCEQMAARAAVVRAVAPRLPPHSHSCGPGSSLLMGGADDWAQAATCDFYGNSMHQTFNTLEHAHAKTRWCEFPLALDGTRSASPYTWVSELRSGQQAIGFQGIFYPPEDLRHWLWTIAAHGVRGVLFWQFKPERIGPEAPECGVTTLDGQETPRQAEMREFGGFCRDHGEFLLNARPPSSGIGMLCGYKQGVMGTLAGTVAGLPNLHQESLAGLYRSLWQASIPVEFVNIDRVLHYPPKDLPAVLILPFFVYLDAGQAAFLRSFVADGGVLVAEGGLGTYDDRGWHAKTLPAFGLDTVFGVREREKIAVDRVTFTVDGTAAAGRHYRRELVLAGAETIGCFDDGTAAVTRHAFGAGTAFYIATHPGLECIAAEKSPALELLPRLLKPWLKTPLVAADDGVTVRLLRRGDEVMVFAFNRGRAPGTARLSLAVAMAENLSR